MKNRMPLIIAIILGLLAALLAYYYVNWQKTDLGVEKTFLVAKAQIKKGIAFKKSFLGSKRIPEKYAPLNGVLLKDMNNVIDTRTAVRINKGQVIQWAFIETGLESDQLSKRLKKGERAFTLAVNRITGLEGMIRPNDRVDIIGTFTVNKGGKSTVITSLINQNVTVLAVGNQFGADAPGNISSVTIKVTAQESEILTFADMHGKLRLILRSPEDLEIIPNLPNVDFNNVIKLEKKATKKKTLKRPKLIYN